MDSTALKQEIGVPWQPIARELLKIANHTNPARSLEDLHPSLQARLTESLRSGHPIRMVLPAFPAKSGNRRKTYSPLPDLGEVLALKRLNALCETISHHHRPGAKLVICSDGRVFSDLVGVTERDVTQYGASLRNICENHQLNHLGFFDLEEVFPGCEDFQEMRGQLEKEYAEPLEALKDRVKENPQTQALFNGIHRFVKEDYFYLYPKLSRNKISRLSKEIAYKVIQRSNAWSHLVERAFPEAVRLSIHPQPPHSPKFPVRLLPGKDRWGTPWHRVALYDGKTYQLVRHSETRPGSLRTTPEGYVYFEGGVA